MIQAHRFVESFNRARILFAMALGAGLDIRASKHIDVRAGQVDYLPVFFSHKREDGLRFSAGVKIKP